MDYSKITADPVRGPEIGQMYLDASPFITKLARFAYMGFTIQVERQFQTLTSPNGYGLDVVFQEEDPYPNAEAMFEDINLNRRLRVYMTSEDQSHPLLNRHANDMFRAVHDYHGHYQTGRGFDRHGEEAAWVRHSQMFTGLARRAMTTETRGQSSALCWLTSPEFPPQKAVLLPDWVSEIPSQWR